MSDPERELSEAVMRQLHIDPNGPPTATQVMNLYMLVSGFNERIARIEEKLDRLLEERRGR